MTDAALRIAALCACAATGLGCATAGGPTQLRDDLFVETLGPGVWRHVSSRELADFGLATSNGLIVATDGGALLVDTAWTPDQTGALLDWTASAVGPVRGVVVTHAHDDRLGGLDVVDARGIASFALSTTASLAADGGGAPIRHEIASGFSLGELGVAGEVAFPGPGHTIDNAVVWLAEPRLLFGGCLVRSSAATSLGNTSEADLRSWPEAIAWLQTRYPHVVSVVPGHGAPGGPELLVHTQALLETAPR